MKKLLLGAFVWLYMIANGFVSVHANDLSEARENLTKLYNGTSIVQVLSQHYISDALYYFMDADLASQVTEACNDDANLWDKVIFDSGVYIIIEQEVEVDYGYYTNFYTASVIIDVFGTRYPQYCRIHGELPNS